MDLKGLSDELLARLISLCQKFSAGHYEGAGDIFELTKEGTYPRQVVELAESFGMMIVKIEARELKLEEMISELERLNRELAIAKERLARENIQLKNDLHRLRIEIDHTRKSEAVAEITESDYFKDLKKKVKDLRSQ